MSRRPAECEIGERGDVLIARIGGEIDGESVAGLRRSLTEQVPSSAQALVVDLSRVSHIDSSGVALLFDLAHRLTARRQAIRLVVPGDAPARRVLEICEIEQAAPLDAEVEGSLRSLERE